MADKFRIDNWYITAVGWPSWTSDKKKIPLKICLQIQAYVLTLKGECHEMDNFWRSNHFNQCSLSMVFKIFIRLSLQYTIVYVLFAFFEITYSFWKCLLKSSTEFPSLRLVNVLHCQTVIGCRKNAPSLLAAERVFKNLYGKYFQRSKIKIDLLLWFFQQEGNKKWWKLLSHIRTTKFSKLTDRKG